VTIEESAQLATGAQSSAEVITTIPVGAKPTGVAVDPDHTTVGVTNFGDGTVSVIDTGTLTVTKPFRREIAPMG
jgi:YVTN family beta-propeller protein